MSKSYEALKKAPLFDEMTKEERVMMSGKNGVIPWDEYWPTVLNGTNEWGVRMTEGKEGMLVMLVKGKPHVLYSTKDTIISEVTEEKLKQVIALFENKGGDPVEISLGGQTVPLKYFFEDYGDYRHSDGSTYREAATGQVSRTDSKPGDEVIRRSELTVSVSMSRDRKCLALAYIDKEVRLYRRRVEPWEFAEETAYMSRVLDMTRETAQRDIAAGGYATL